MLQAYTCTIVRLLAAPGGDCSPDGASPVASPVSAASPVSGDGGGGCQMVPHLLEPDSQVEVMAPDAVLEPG